MLSLRKQIPMQSLLYKTTTCLTQPVTTFFVSQIKKNLSKTTTIKLYPAKKWETYVREQCIKKWIFLWLYLLCWYFIMHNLFFTFELLYNLYACLFNVYKNWRIYKIIYYTIYYKIIIYVII